MPAKTHGERLDRLEQVVGMDEDQARTEERFREMAHQNAQRSRELDDRVDKLVLAIGELIRNPNAPRA
jgi:hypothetical protein